MPIVVDGDGVIIKGHGRLLACKKLGMATVPVIVRDDLTPAQAKAARIADNKVSESDWDMDMLRIELAELGDMDFDLDLTGFGDFDFGLDEEPVEGLTDEDDTPEPPAEPRTKLGDVWLCGNHRVHCGDSTSIDAVDKLMDGKKADCVITDPPYGIGIDGQKESKSKNPKHNRKAHEFKGWDKQRPCDDIFNFIIALNIPVVIWGGNYFADLLPPTRGWIYWSKGQDGLTMSDGELAWTNSKKPLRCVVVNRAALQGSVHPTQKPLKVIEFSLAYIDAGNIVLDVFGGSGSTLIACEKTNRTCYMMELDTKYVDVIVNRWQNFTGKKATLESTGELF